MFYQIKRLLVKEGFSGWASEKFSKRGGLIEKQPGFIGKEVLIRKSRRGDEEVLIVIRWESETDWKNWEKHPDHIASHKANIGKPKPEFIMETSQDVYESL